MSEKKDFIEVEDLVIRFPKKSRKLIQLHPEYFHAVDHVNFHIARGETFGLVGESGSGKSTIGKAILGYLHAENGSICYDGEEITGKNDKEMLPYRKKMQSVFQDPYSSLDPSMTIREIICEPMEIHHMYTKEERSKRAGDLLEAVGLSRDDLRRYPYEFSGGQRQRISIARALSVDPEFVVCDEPISALDVSLQAQIVFMLQDLQKKMHLTYLFISHQLQVVQKICDHIGVLYLGSLMEEGTSQAVYENPLHPYTQTLMSSILEADPDVHSLDHISADSGVQQYGGKGCKFCNRCPHAKEECREKEPGYYEAEPGHFVRCFMYKN
ncbi:MAG: ABC transporter ATP-binding protein [Eubacteriales bacterium]|nr:ABC transporter ATP-binding protein [Eubacteriales bacterium]